jgi:hypothetical protein
MLRSSSVEWSVTLLRTLEKGHCKPAIQLLERAKQLSSYDAFTNTAVNSTTVGMLPSPHPIIRQACSEVPHSCLLSLLSSLSRSAETAAVVVHSRRRHLEGQRS